jgi:acid phosphatase type 7
MVGAGDIADCRELGGAVATAKLLDGIPGTIFATGDLADPDGTAEEFKNCYGPTWGRFRLRTKPTTGNHEYHVKDAADYFQYWGNMAGKLGQGYYSYDLGAWHIVVINSACSEIGGCGPGSAQEVWLREDLAAHPAACTLAYWHHPLFSSGKHGGDPEMKPLWQSLYRSNADVVVNGHDHDYERFAPQDPDGRPDPQRGIREFIAGTGGRHTRTFGNPVPNSEVRHTRTFGVLKLTLLPTSYEWRFIPVAGQSFSDSGSGVCH